MGALAIIQIIIVALPLLLELIKLVEAAIQNAEVKASGSDKKAQVVTMFSSIWQQLATTDPNNKIYQLPLDQLMTVVSPWIDEIVLLLNNLGIFKKSVPVTPKPA